MPKPGHGDHWLAALHEGDPRLQDALAVPLDAPDGVGFHRSPLNEALDMVQVTAKRRLVTAYPEPRATTLAMVEPREMGLWETRVEGWLVVEHETVGALTLFLTDLVENAKRYQDLRGAAGLELGALAYSMRRAHENAGPSRLRPASKLDERFLPDDYSFDADVRAVHTAGAGEVLDLEFHGGLTIPVATKEPGGLRPGDRAQGLLWLTGRWPEGSSPNVQG